MIYHDLGLEPGACDKRPGRVSSLSLVRYKGNDYSVPVAYGHREVLIRGYVDRVVISCAAEVIARHKRSYERVTDQEGVGRKVGIPHGRTRWCPVTALNDWLERSGVEEGPVFRRVDRHGKLLGGRLSGAAVSLVIKARVAAVGLDPDDYSGHSLRAGLATSAAASGVSSWKIRQQTGHASDAMLARYIRDGELFVDNAAGALL